MNEHLKSVINLVQQSKGLSDDEKKGALSALEKVGEELRAYEVSAGLEASLEKVRHKTMKMRNTGDVAETVALMFQEMTALGVKTIRAGIGIMKEDMKMEIWTSNAEAKENAELIVGLLT